MATLTTTRRTYKDTGSTNDVYCLRIVTSAGVTYRFTDSAADLVMTTYNNAGTAAALPSAVTYTSVAIDFSASSIIEAQPSAVDINAVFTELGIGKYELKGARFYVFITDFNNPVEDDEAKFTGIWTSADVRDGEIKLRARSLIDVLNVPAGRVRSTRCNVQFGSALCRFPIELSTWQASTAVTAPTDGDARTLVVVEGSTQRFPFYCSTAGTTGSTEPTWPGSGSVTDGSAVWTRLDLPYIMTDLQQASTYTSGSLTDSVFISVNGAAVLTAMAGGTVEITSGTGAGQKRIITGYGGGNYFFTIDLPWEIAPDITSRYTIKIGCAKRLSEDCATTYNNYHNFQGYPYLPGETNLGYVGGTK